MWSLDDDLQGMNLSLQVEDFELEGEEEERLEMARAEREKVSRRSEVPDIPAGRFNPGFLASGDSILCSSKISWS